MYKSIEEIQQRIKEVEEIYKETRAQRIALAKRMDDLGISTVESPILFTEEATMDDSHTQDNSRAQENSETPEEVFIVGTRVTLVDPWTVVDVIEVNEDATRAKVKYYDAVDGGDIERWISSGEILTRKFINESLP